MMSGFFYPHLKRLHYVAAMTVTLAFCAPMSAHAAEAVPAGSCAGYPTNGFQWAGGPENTGVLNGMFCNGTTWTGVLNLQNTGRLGIGNTSPGTLLDIGKAAATLGTMRLEGNTSGYVQIQPAAAAGSWTMTLPTGAGSAGQALTTNGSGVASWTAGSIAFSGIGAATTTDTMDSGAYAQVWNWNSLTTGTALKLASSSVTTGTLLSLKNSSTTGVNSTLTVENTSATDAAVGVQGLSSNATGVTYGLYGRTYSSSGIGVYGRGEIASGIGVSGEAVNATGTGTAVSGSAASTGQGVGVYATSTGANNTGQALVALNNSTTGWGVYSSGTSPSYFGAKVGIGTSSPTKGGLVVNKRAGTTFAVFGQGQKGISFVGGSGASDVEIGFNAYANSGWYSSGGGHAGIVGVTPSVGVMYFATNTSSPATDASVTGIGVSPLINSSGYVGVLNGSPASALDVTGDIHFTGALQDTSDRRMKRDIKPLMPDQAARLDALKPVSFVMKGDKKRRTELGFIAQDTQPVYPDLILTDPKGMRSMNYVGLIAPMVAAMKERQAEIDELKAENRALSDRLDMLVQIARSRGNR